MRTFLVTKVIPNSNFNVLAITHWLTKLNATKLYCTNLIHWQEMF